MISIILNKSINKVVSYIKKKITHKLTKLFYICPQFYLDLSKYYLHMNSF